MALYQTPTKPVKRQVKERSYNTESIESSSAAASHQSPVRTDGSQPDEYERVSAHRKGRQTAVFVRFEVE